MADWIHRKTISMTRSPWVTIHTEQWEDEQGRLLDYWRVERADSVIVLPIHRERFLLPEPMFRPGVRAATWDFPGGRLAPECKPHEQVPAILGRELEIPNDAIEGIVPINLEPWTVDSAFSSQRLWGFIARIRADWMPKADRMSRSEPADPQGARSLLNDLECLQCRALLLQWLLGEQTVHSSSRRRSWDLHPSKHY